VGGDQGENEGEQKNRSCKDEQRGDKKTISPLAKHIPRGRWASHHDRGGFLGSKKGGVRRPHSMGGKEEKLEQEKGRKEGLVPLLLEFRR